MILGAFTEELNLFQICEMFESQTTVTSIYHACSLSMHGSWLNVTFTFVQIQVWASHRTHKMFEYWPVITNNLSIINWVKNFLIFINLWPAVDLMVPETCMKG
jgi:uncharacterized protein YpbB